MSRNWKTLVLGGASLVIAVCATSAVLIGRASTDAPKTVTNGSVQTQTTPRLRNLSVQPEAARVNRRLGNKFKFSGRVESTLSGRLTIGANHQQVTVIRRQTESGELVEVQLPGRRLTWSDAEGVKAVEGLATVPERLLVERLVFDSLDQFVLAQLRGASYFTIRRNLRPSDAGDNYTGPLWRLVRVSEPQHSEDTAPGCRWRLYYVNESTDLIDRVSCELDGQTMEASLQWTEHQGKPIPSHVKWTTSGQTIMELEVTAFSQSE